MSMNKNVYVILGYDLDKYREEILKDDFVWSDRGEELTCNQTAGEVQLFYDPESEKHLYLGYILGDIEDDYSDYEKKDIILDFAGKRKEVDKVLIELIGEKKELPFEHVIFTEWR